MRWFFRERTWNLSHLLTLLIAIILLGSFYSWQESAAKAGAVKSAASTINFGETVSGSISASAETDTYTFTANAGDVVLK